MQFQFMMQRNRGYPIILVVVGDIHLVIFFVLYQHYTWGFPLDNIGEFPISSCATSQVGNSLLKMSI